MKKAIVAAVLLGIVFLLGQTCSAMEFGHPAPYEENCMLGWFYNPKLKLKTDSSVLPTIEIKQHQAYWQLDFFSTEKWEGYARLGIFELRIDEAFKFDTVKDFKAGINAFGALGVKGVIFKIDSWGIGPFIVGTIYEDCEEQAKGKVSQKAVSTKLSVKNIWNIKYGIGIQGKVLGIIVYGGPFASSDNADIEAQEAVLGIAAGASAKAKYERKNSGGIFFGAKIPLDEGFNITVEAEYTGELAVGLSLNIKFE